jgi:hypothetical protein
MKQAKAVNADVQIPGLHRGSDTSSYIHYRPVMVDDMIGCFIPRQGDVILIIKANCHFQSSVGFITAHNC